MFEWEQQNIGICRGKSGDDGGGVWSGGETYYEIVAYPRGDLCERVGGARCDEHDVCPAPELDVQYRVSDAIVWLRGVPQGQGGKSISPNVSISDVVYKDTGRNGTEETHIPFVVVRPDVDVVPADVLRIEERERRLGRGHLYRHVPVLERGPRGAGETQWGGGRGSVGRMCYLEELLDYEGRLDGRDAAGRDEENVGVALAAVGRCGEVP
jgi:hypothetical protein